MYVTHIKQTAREQYPEDEYELSIQSVKFSHETHDEPAIGIEFRENLGDWLLGLQGGKDKKVQNKLKPLLTVTMNILPDSVCTHIHRSIWRMCVSGTTPHHST